jgi:uncharacterized membrane protein YraQ (UPF0718 family)
MAFDHIMQIVEFMTGAFLHMWPYLLVTIPLSVAVKMSGAARYINRAFKARPLTAIFLATAVGAFSPFCSCGVIPVVAALLIGGVPLAPVMSFWIASPSMDPEAFFLSVSMIGWELAVWRLAGTLVLSLMAGFITLALERRGWFGSSYIREYQARSTPRIVTAVRSFWQTLKRQATAAFQFGILAGTPVQISDGVCCATAPLPASVQLADTAVLTTGASAATCGDCSTGELACAGVVTESFPRRLLRETWDATTMVLRFMLLAFFLEALIDLYVPSNVIAGVVGGRNPLAILTAAILGVPMYTSNLAALPMIGGLLDQGMSPAAALAFLIAGPTTTLPAMTAVWGLVSRRVFLVYVAMSLVGAVLLGYAFVLISAFL